MGTAATGPRDKATLDLRARLAILDNSPVRRTAADATQAIDATGLKRRNRVKRAIRDRYRIDLIPRCCDAPAPTQATVHFERLEELR
jgi:hypothetical protein